ncbi:hypothetical protein K3495_g11920, partial [Podosphaera aphanis]
MEHTIQRRTPEIGSNLNPLIADWDSPENSQQPGMEIDTLEYDDRSVDDPFTEPAPAGPIKEALTKSVDSMTARAKEAEALFGDISVLLDKQCSAASRGSLPERQYAALKNFCQDLAKVAGRHFDAYICDKPAPTTNLAPTSSRETRGTVPKTYASVTKRGPVNQDSQNNPPSQPVAKAHLQPKSNRPDDRLFVRIPEGDKIRELSAYSIQAHLKAKLGSDSQLLTNVQPTKT